MASVRADPSAVLVRPIMNHLWVALVQLVMALAVAYYCGHKEGKRNGRN